MLSLSLSLPNIAIRNRGGGLDLNAFMAAQSDGLWFDFTKTDRLFQENTGPTPANDPGEVIGLAMSQRVWEGKTLAELLAGQAELATNGSFDVNVSGWTATGGATVTWESGRAKVVTTTSNQGIFQTIPTQAGVSHQVQAQLTAGAGLARIRAGADVTDASNDGPEVSSGTASTVFRASGATSTIYMRFANAGTHYVDAVTAKAVPGKHGTQATLNYRGKFQPTGKKYDGSDDFDFTPYTLSGATDAFVFDYADIPAVISATQILLGTQNAGGEAFYLAVTTGGALRLKIGSTTIDSTGVDIRGGQHAVGAYTSGTTAYLLVDGVVVGSGTYSGSLPTTTWYLGAVNNNGTSAAFFGGSLKTPLTGRDALTLTQARQLSTAVAAA